MNYTTTMQFIELFRHFRALWDKTDNDYLNKDVRMRQRKMIGQRMGMTEVDVGKKICNLRTYYIREMVKRDKAIMQGHATHETYSSKWPYFDALDVFLGGVVQKRRYESLTSYGLRPDSMYLEDHNSDTDNDVSDLSRLDDNDQAREMASSGDSSLIHVSTGEASRDSYDGPPLKRAKQEPAADVATNSCSADAGDSSSGNNNAQHEQGGTGASVSPPSSTTSFHLLPPSPAFIPAPTRPSWFAAHREQRGVLQQPLCAMTSSVNMAGGAHAQGSFGPGVVVVGGGGGDAGTVGSNPASSTGAPPGGLMAEEDDDWLFGRYLVRELKKVKDFKEKQLAKMKMQQIVTYAQLGMSTQSSDADVANT